MGLSQEVGELKQGLPDGYNIERDRFQLPKAIKYMGTPRHTHIIILINNQLIVSILYEYSYE